MVEPKNLGIVSRGLGENLAPLRRKVEDLIREIRAFEGGPRLLDRSPQARPVVLWLQNTRDPDYRARLTDQCRRLAEMTADEEAMAAAFEQEAAQTLGWR